MPLIDDGFSGNHISEIRKWNDVKTGFTHFAEGDIGVAKITPCFENRKSTVFKNLYNGYGAGTTELHILRTYADTISHKFLLSFVKTDYFIQAGKQTFSGAVGQQRIGKEYISNSLFPLPPLAAPWHSPDSAGRGPRACPRTAGRPASTGYSCPPLEDKR